MHIIREFLQRSEYVIKGYFSLYYQSTQDQIQLPFSVFQIKKRWLESISSLWYLVQSDGNHNAHILQVFLVPVGYLAKSRGKGRLEQRVRGQPWNSVAKRPWSEWEVKGECFTLILMTPHRSSCLGFAVAGLKFMVYFYSHSLGIVLFTLDATAFVCK